MVIHINKKESNWILIVTEEGCEKEITFQKNGIIWR